VSEINQRALPAAKGIIQLLPCGVQKMRKRGGATWRREFPMLHWEKPRAVRERQVSRSA
jgi:hypothetical protein